MRTIQQPKSRRRRRERKLVSSFDGVHRGSWHRQGEEHLDSEPCKVHELPRRGPVDLAAKKRLLEDLARRLGIDVRCEPLEPGPSSSVGGLCRIRSRYTILIDSRAPIAEQVGVLFDALAQPVLESHFSVALDLQRPWP